MHFDEKHLIAIVVLVHVLMRLLKAGKLKQWIPARWRPFAALWLGAIAVVVERVAYGMPWQDAALVAALGVAGAVLGHDVLIEGMRGGKEVGLDWLVRLAGRGTVVLLLVMPLVGCTSAATQTQAVAADTVARVTNATLPSLVEAYDQEGLAAIEASDSRDEAEYRLELVREKWRPVWEALEVFASVHDAWATALEAGTDTAAIAAEVRDAYCTLRGAALPSVELPDYPVIPCGGGP